MTTRKYNRIHVNITEEFRASLHEAAEIAGQSYSEFVISTLTEACQARGISAQNAVPPRGGTKGGGSRVRRAQR